jgi:hypothetical protein
MARVRTLSLAQHVVVYVTQQQSLASATLKRVEDRPEKGPEGERRRKGGQA